MSRIRRISSDRITTLGVQPAVDPDSQAALNSTLTGARSALLSHDVIPRPCAWLKCCQVATSVTQVALVLLRQHGTILKKRRQVVHPFGWLLEGCCHLAMSRSMQAHVHSNLDCLSCMHIYTAWGRVPTLQEPVCVQPITKPAMNSL